MNQQLYFEFMVMRDCLFVSNQVNNSLQIAKGQLRLLEALLATPSRIATIDDATENLADRFDDGGKWRGQVTLGLYLDGVIDRVGADNSQRPHRNRGLLRVWRLISESKAVKRIQSLRRFIQEKENPQSAATDAGNRDNTNSINNSNGVNENAFK